MTDRITESDLRSIVETINDYYEAELILHVFDSAGSGNTYRLREKRPDSAERDIGPAGSNREMWHFLQGIKYAENEWIDE